MVVVILALAVTVAIGILRGASAPVEQVSVEEASTAGTDAATRPLLYVHVSGAVAAPGLYALDEHARVVDAIAAAGGFADGADEGAVNLARPLSDGEQLHVGLIGEPLRADRVLEVRVGLDHLAEDELLASRDLHATDCD